MRNLAPASSYIGNLGNILDALLSSTDTAKEVLSLFPARSGISFSNSGTSSLTSLLKYLQKEKGIVQAYIPAYCCPDIPAAAVEANLGISLLDMNPNSLEIQRPENLASNSVVIFPNLYGIPDSIDCWEGITIIDDAAQAGLSFAGGVRVGSRGDYGILSFGRGKAFAAASGGALLSNHKTNVAESVSSGGSTKIVTSILGLIAEHPLLFGLASKLPFLKVGEVIYPDSILEKPITNLQLKMITARLKVIDEVTAVHKRHVAYYENLLSGQSGISLPSVIRNQTSQALTRFPVVFADAGVRNRVFSELSSAGLGVSLSYNRTLDTFSQLSKYLGAYSGAKLASQTLLTLPVHGKVRTEDLEKICKVIKSSLQ